MEFLSSAFDGSNSPVYLIMQALQSMDANYNAAGTGSFEVHQLPFIPSQGFHEYRFDWTPQKVSFYADGQWLKELVHRYPTAPGEFATASIAYTHAINDNYGTLYLCWAEKQPREYHHMPVYN